MDYEHCFLDCDYRTKTEEALISHTRKHETSIELRLPYPCAVVNCKYRAGSKTSLNLHVWAKHTSGKASDVQCPISPLKFYWKSSLQEHIQTHTKEKKYNCDQYKFTSHCRRFISYHVKAVHENVKAHKCTLPGCSFSTLTQTHLNKHLQTHSVDPLVGRPLPCDFPDCDYRASAITDLRRHTVVRHNPTRTRDHPCTLCAKSFYSTLSLKCYIRSVHSKEKVYRCSECEYETKFCGSLKLHTKRVHEGVPPEKKFNCDTCHYRCAEKMNLQNHKMTAHSDIRRFKCTNCNCDYKTNYLAAFSRHLRTHEEDPGKRYPFACSFPVCDFRRRAADEIKSHEQRHQVSKVQLKCKLCPNRTYPDRISLNFHERIAHIKKSYECSTCSYSGLTRLNLEEHTRECHKEQASSDDNQERKGIAIRRWERKHKNGKAIAGGETRTSSVFFCSHCGFEADNKDSLLHHSIVHRFPVVLLKILRLQIKCYFL